jgi:hypothetical protein
MTIGAIAAGRPILVNGQVGAQLVVPRPCTLLGILLNQNPSSLTLYDWYQVSGHINYLFGTLPLSSGYPYLPLNFDFVNGIVIANFSAGAIATFIVA